jgi:hypothetical protein
VGAELSAHDVGLRVAEHLGADRYQRANGQQVGQGAGDREQRGLLAEHPGDPLLQRVDDAVLVIHVVAGVGRLDPRHRGQHRRSGAGDGVAAQVDHGAERTGMPAVG